MKVKESILETLSAFNEEEKDLKDRSPPNWRRICKRFDPVSKISSRCPHYSLQLLDVLDRSAGMPTHYEKLDTGLYDVEGTVYIQLAGTHERLKVSGSSEDSAGLKPCSKGDKLHLD
jgi:hypothetical protein